LLLLLLLLFEGSECLSRSWVLVEKALLQLQLRQSFVQLTFITLLLLLLLLLRGWSLCWPLLLLLWLWLLLWLLWLWDAKAFHGRLLKPGGPNDTAPIISLYMPHAPPPLQPTPLPLLLRLLPLPLVLLLLLLPSLLSFLHRPLH
jgi:hypothetical protein